MSPATESVSGVGRSAASVDGFDVTVVGAGVLGLAVAVRLSRAGRSVLVIEREPGIARGITSRNSEVVHAGLYYPSGSLKAQSCVEGRERLYAWCAEARVAHRRLGKLVVATRVSEVEQLEALLAQGRRNGVAGLELIDAQATRALEPDVAAQAALHSPETGIVDAHALCMSLLAAAEAAGGSLALERRVESLTRRSYGWSVAVRDAAGTRESIDTGLVVDAAGLAADRVAELAGLPIDTLGWRQRPCKGDYFKLAPGSGSASAPRVRLDRLVYPVPQAAGLGIHATLDLAGGLRFGPDAEYLVDPGASASSPTAPEPVFEFAVDPAKEARFREAVARYLPRLNAARFEPDYAGIRPKLAGPGEAFRDFVVVETSDHGVPGFVACLGIESPGLTAALALAERVALLTIG